VQLGIELVTEPSVLLADEPCSGLSAWDTDNVMRHLRGLGDRGRTILVTIHSPDVEALEMMDRLLLLDRGGVVAYFGPAYPDSLTYFSRCEPSPYQSPKLIFDVLERRKRDGSDDRKTPPHRWRQIYEATPMREECVSQVQESLVGAEPERPDAVDRASPRPSYRRQLVVQTRRRALQQWRDKMDVAITLGQAPILALSFFAVFLARSYGQPTFIPLTRYSAEALGPILVLAVLTAVWFGATKGIVEFPGAWQEYRHERLTFLRIPEFVLPRFVVLGALVGAQVALFAWTFGLLFVLLPDWLNPDLSTLSSPGGWAALLRFARFSLDLSLLLWLVALAAIGTSFFLSTFLRTRGAAAALLPCFLIAQTLLAGVNPLIHKMPEGARTVAGAMASRWGYEAMALLCDRHLAAKGPRGETKTPFTSRARLDPRGEVLARTLAAAPPTPTELAAFRSIEPILEGVTGGYVQSYRSNLARLEGHPGEASQVVAEGYLLVGLLAIANTEELEQPALRAAWQALMRRAPELASFRPGHGAFCWRSLALLAVVTLVLACGMIRLRESSPRW
jgi:hypothetical protein